MKTIGKETSKNIALSKKKKAKKKKNEIQKPVKR